MVQDLVEFVWDRPETRDGYRVVEVKVSTGTRELVLAQNRWARFTGYSPLKDETGAFLNFAETDPSQKGILDFVNRFGRLGGRDTAFDLLSGSLPSDVLDAPLESVREWQKMILNMKSLVQTWRAVRENDRESLSRFIRWDGDRQVFYHPPTGMRPKEPYCIASFNENRELFTRLQGGELERPAMFVVSLAIHQYLVESDIALGLPWDHVTGRPSFKLRPRSLLDGLWLQFALAVEGNKEYRQCRECGKWFELSPSVNRANKQTCSSSCRNKGYYRRQEEARRMHAEGKAPKVIAEALGVDSAKIKNWLKGPAKKGK
jgi:hypothetical protein